MNKAAVKKKAAMKLVASSQAAPNKVKSTAARKNGEHRVEADSMVEVGIIMGSSSDLPVMKEAGEMLAYFGIKHEIAVVSAHRTPEVMLDYARTARNRGLKVIIAGAGGAAHLPGMVASVTTLPVIGVPIKSSNSIDGWDSVLSILQMPAGIPVATVALNGARNAGILAATILGTCDAGIAKRLEDHKVALKQKVLEMNNSLG